MDSNQRKLFVGGISWEAKEETLKEHFQQYGEVVETVILKDRITGNARGFGFVLFSEPSAAEKALQEKHVILGRTVEVRKAKPRGDQQQTHQRNSQNKEFGKNTASSSGSNTNDGANQIRTKKIFVGGLPSNLTEQAFRSYFEKFGRVTDVVVMYDTVTKRPRGFGFITFDSEEAVEAVMQNTYHDLIGKLVEAKRAVPKDASPGHNGHNNGSYYASMGSGTGAVYGNHQGSFYPLYSHGYRAFPNYLPSPVSGYANVVPYMHGMYPFGGYNGVVYSSPYAPPRSPWNGLGIVGAQRSPMPYGSSSVYPAYMNGGVGSYAGASTSNFFGAVASNGTWNQNVSKLLTTGEISNGVTPTHSEDEKLDNDASDPAYMNGCSGSYAGASSSNFPGAVASNGTFNQNVSKLQTTGKRSNGVTQIHSADEKLDNDASDPAYLNGFVGSDAGASSNFLEAVAFNGTWNQNVSKMQTTEESSNGVTPTHSGVDKLDNDASDPAYMNGGVGSHDSASGSSFPGAVAFNGTWNQNVSELQTTGESSDGVTPTHSGEEKLDNDVSDPPCMNGGVGSPDGASSSSFPGAVAFNGTWNQNVSKLQTIGKSSNGVTPTHPGKLDNDVSDPAYMNGGVGSHAGASSSNFPGAVAFNGKWNQNEIKLQKKGKNRNGITPTHSGVEKLDNDASDPAYMYGGLGTHAGASSSNFPGAVAYNGKWNQNVSKLHTTGKSSNGVTPTHSIVEKLDNDASDPAYMNGVVGSHAGASSSNFSGTVASYETCNQNGSTLQTRGECGNSVTPSHSGGEKLDSDASDSEDSDTAAASGTKNQIETEGLLRLHANASYPAYMNGGVGSHAGASSSNFSGTVASYETCNQNGSTLQTIGVCGNSVTPSHSGGEKLDSDASDSEGSDTAAASGTKNQIENEGLLRLHANGVA